jgi:hypothetical protein
MHAQESGGTSGENRGTLSAQEVVAWLQELVDTRPTGTGVSLEWAVSAYFLGDVNGLASVSLVSDN